MARALVTFLGKQYSRDGQASYLRMAYDLPDGTTTPPARYFAVELYRWLARSGRAVDRLIVLGTPTSMWRTLWDLTDSEDLELWEAIERDSIGAGVNPTQLAQAGAALSAALGVQVDCRLITSARTRPEQLEVIDALQSSTAGCDRVVLDITHGYRHLPLIATVAARLLQHTGQHVVEHIYYGMEHDLTGPPPPGPRRGAVIDLGGLLRLLDVSEGLSTWQTTGRLTPLANALHGLLPDAAMLGYFHDLRQPSRARALASRARQALNASADPLLEMLRAPLQGVLTRLASTHDPAWQHLDHATAAFRHRDLPGMLIHLREAVAHHLSLNGAPQEHIQALRVYLGKSDFRQLNQLRDLRNAVAHGGASHQSRDELKSPARMEHTLRSLLAFVRRTLNRPGF